MLAPNKLTIGLTGGIGSGKSTVAELFRQRDIAIIDADVIAREVVEKDSPALKAIEAHFGEDFLCDGELNRQRLREHIFNHPQDKKWLEHLLHPLIRKTMLKEINDSKSPYCILVIPLLIENLPHPLVKRILLVDAPEALQLARATKRDKAHEAEIKKIIAAQMARDKRLMHTDDVILNDGHLDNLNVSVEKLHQVYLLLADNLERHGSPPHESLPRHVSLDGDDGAKGT